MVGTNYEDGQIVLLAGGLFGFVARGSHDFSWSCLPRSCEYCIRPWGWILCGFCVPGFWVWSASSCGTRRSAGLVRSCGWLLKNVACNTPINLSGIEIGVLQFHRFGALLNAGSGELHATFVWCPPSGPRGVGGWCARGPFYWWP